MLRRISTVAIGLLMLSLPGYYLWMREAKTLVVDRSVCSDEDWARVAGVYSGLHRGHVRGKLRISKVILVNDAGETVLRKLPLELRSLERYGKQDTERLAQLMDKYPNPELMTCDRTLMQQLDPDNLLL